MKTMLKVLAVVLALLLCCASALANGTDNSLTNIQLKKQLILGFDDSFAPMGYINEDGNVVGFDIDVAMEVCTRIGSDIELVPTPIDWDKKEELLKDGVIDCIWNGFSISMERLATMQMTSAYMKNAMVLVVRADSGITVRAELEGKKLGYQAGSTAEEALDEKQAWKESLGSAAAYVTNDEALKALEQGELDAVLVDHVVADWYITTHAADLVCLEERMMPEEYGIAFRFGEEALANAVQDALEDMVKDGSLAKISEKWFGRDVTTVKDGMPGYNY